MVYWQAGRDLLHHGWTAVYDVETLTPFKYHPAFALFFAPWAVMPSTAARLAWAALNGLALLDMQHRWQARWNIDAAAIGIGFLGVAYALTWQFKFANVTFLMLWLWTVALTSPGPWRAALCYAVLIALKPFWLALLMPWALARRLRLTGMVTLLLAALSLLPIVFGIEALQLAYERWIATFADPLHAHNFPKRDNQGWYGLLYRHHGTLGGILALVWLAGSAAVGALWLWPWRRAVRHGTAPQANAALELSLIPFILWTAPLSWVHHQILLWPLLAWLWQSSRGDRATRVVWGGSWALLNGTGRLLLGRSLSRAAYQWGVPILAFPLLAFWSSKRLAAEALRGHARSGSPGTTLKPATLK